MIITNNEKSLRVQCEDVKPEEIANLIEILESELDYANRLGKGGIGLAAPQIGIAKKIAIVRLSPTLKFDLVNCKIEQGFDPATFKEEGCLSFPGRVENTMRFQEIYVTGNAVYPHTFIATGLPAVVCQHEIDHYSNTLFFDHMIKKLIPSVNHNKIGPNDPCVCGKIDAISGKVKKFKKCCGK